MHLLLFWVKIDKITILTKNDIIFGNELEPCSLVPAARNCGT